MQNLISKNFFQNSFEEILAKMFKSSVRFMSEQEKELIKVDGWLDVLSLINLVGSKLSGAILVSFNLPALQSIFKSVFNESISEINEEAADLVGEIANQMAGRVKTALSPAGISFEMSSPLIWWGQVGGLKNLDNKVFHFLEYEVNNSGKALLAFLVEEI